MSTMHYLDMWCFCQVLPNCYDREVTVRALALRAAGRAKGEFHGAACVNRLLGK
jgi:hypothetical protein